ncbi:FlgD immunoglobulin-like domain containing protein [Thiomonas sp.]|jgi:flagellar basal-body rod modification protein FlgD|uniref:flagellar hook assembly protein FlgD n=1 Tax=Thiomonas sp. TaxID=2047785 RepID=UPI00263694DD|nr:FlgD immunoglobulin-like domain containing protein [Thiomonas sp.]
MSTSPIGNNPFLASLESTGSSSSSGTSGSSALGNANTFYNLLVTQLTNQDPLNPMSNTDLSAQLAQFSTASGVQAMQQSLAALTSQLAQTQSLQAASLVGRNVVFDDNSLSLGASGGSAGGFTLASGAQDVQVQISNAAGQVVNTLDLGSMAAGVQSFNWNGNDASGAAAGPGSYTFAVQATDANGASVGAAPFGSGQVVSVMLNGGSSPTLQIQGQNGSIPLSGVVGVM